MNRETPPPPSTPPSAPPAPQQPELTREQREDQKRRKDREQFIASATSRKLDQLGQTGGLFDGLELKTFFGIWLGKIKELCELAERTDFNPLYAAFGIQNTDEKQRQLAEDVKDREDRLKHLAPRISQEKIATLKASEAEMLSTIQGESQGKYMYRVLTLTVPTVSDRIDPQPGRLLRTLQISLKSSGVNFISGPTNLKKCAEAKEETPTLKKLAKNDVVFFEKNPGKVQMGGFYEGYTQKGEAKIVTVDEKGNEVHYEIPWEDVQIVFCLNGNREKSKENEPVQSGESQ